MHESEVSAQSTRECPTVETLQAFASDRLSGEERQTTLKHLERCSRCRTRLLTLPETSADLVDSLRGDRLVSAGGNTAGGTRTDAGTDPYPGSFPRPTN